MGSEVDMESESKRERTLFRRNQGLWATGAGRDVDRCSCVAGCECRVVWSTGPLAGLVCNGIDIARICYRRAPAGTVVRLSATREGEMVRFRVADEGHGVPEGDAQKIFDKFHQVDSSDSRSHGGSGLGLAIARHMVSQHGGRLWLEGNPRGGAVFWELPMAPIHNTKGVGARVRP